MLFYRLLLFSLHHLVNFLEGFSYPGIGTATTAAALNADVPLLLGIALCSAMFVFAGNLMANILYGVFDPRIREGEEYV